MVSLEQGASSATEKISNFYQKLMIICTSQHWFLRLPVTCNIYYSILYEHLFLAPSKKNPNSRLLLPTWMQYVTWFLCAVIIVCSTVLTIWIGFRFDEVRSILWLQSLYISVLFCIFVVHPILVSWYSLRVLLKRLNTQQFNHQIYLKEAGWSII